MKATSQKALIMSEKEMRAFSQVWPYMNLDVEPANSFNEEVGVLDNFQDRITKELERESATQDEGKLR